MKKLLFFISLSFLSSSLIAQEANPNYFHDLSGFEDSTGTTQLFYRLYEPNIRECSYEDHNGETYTTEVNPYRNNLRHFDQSTNSDSIYLKDYTWDRPFCETLPYNLMSFTLVDNNISRPYSIYQSISGLTGGTWLGNIDESLFDLGIANPMAIDFDQNNNSLVISSPASELIIKSNTENNYEAILKKTYRLPLGQESLWSGKAYYDEYPDSLLIDFTVVGINPFSSSQYVGFKNDSIVTSSDRGVSYEKIIVHDLSTFNYEGNRFDKTLFDADGNTFYLRTKEIWTVNSSPNIYRVMNSQDNWSFTELLSDSRSRRMTIDSSNTGHIYLSDSTKVFFSEDYGETMYEILEFEEEVTGLYKKPDSGILYVLTKTDLYKVENGQPTSIKQVPVSNEKTPDIPNAVSLKQNYPNPFNPTTTIQFELDKSTFTKLTVYDVLGRKIRELVNEVRPAGTNTIQFDATNLASGVYLYRLEANGVVQTKRLTLIK